MLPGMMKWATLLSAKRLGSKQPRQSEAQRTPFLRDYDRVVFSSAFRRLQDKTQVFPLAESDYVRTRLTHSLETSCVGRSLGTMVGAAVLQRRRIPGLHASDFGAIVAAAALAHDIGNPPFGHSGEDAIRHWFRTSGVARRVALPPPDAADFERFEGNAQGFRILTRLQMPDNEGGLQLTCATLAAFTKYPLASDISDPHNRPSAKKFSFFQSEAAWFEQVAEETGLLRREPGRSWWCRHPLAFLVEAADDICYHFVDFEDGMRLGLLSYEEVRKAFLSVFPKEKQPKHLAMLRAIRYEKEKVEYLRANAIGEVITQCAAVFMREEKALLAGKFEQALTGCIPATHALKKIIDRSRESVYASQRGLEIEAAGFEVIGGLLDLFVEAVEEAAANCLSSRSKATLRLVPEQFIGPKRKPAADPATRLRRMCDFVSGMTDSYAVGLYKKLRGISLPGGR